jgi:hypothetical protein
MLTLQLLTTAATSPGFSGPIRVEFLRDGRLVRVLADASFTDSQGRVWWIREGQIADGASIPRLAWPIVGGPYEGRHRDGALFHDWAYACGGHMQQSEEAGAFMLYERADADRMLLEAMLYRGLNVVSARSIYSAVRLGGWHAWNADRKRGGF